ncbi:hypothetical protein J6590_035400 [Homalodisca vitripennis]|nr:hypothetical protein J6590_035400 [Homalodisca vitripennis]
MRLFRHKGIVDQFWGVLNVNMAHRGRFSSGSSERGKKESGQFWVGRVSLVVLQGVGRHRDSGRADILASIAGFIIRASCYWRRDGPGLTVLARTIVLISPIKGIAYLPPAPALAHPPSPLSPRNAQLSSKLTRNSVNAPRIFSLQPVFFAGRIRNDPFISAAAELDWCDQGIINPAALFCSRYDTAASYAPGAGPPGPGSEPSFNNTVNVSTADRFCGVLLFYKILKFREPAFVMDTNADSALAYQQRAVLLMQRSSALRACPAECRLGGDGSTRTDTYARHCFSRRKTSFICDQCSTFLSRLDVIVQYVLFPWSL